MVVGRGLRGPLHSKHRRGKNVPFPRLCAAPEGPFSLPQNGFSRSFIFAPGGNPTPNVPLGFVQVQNLFDLEIQSPVKGRQPLGQVLVYGRLADSELLCCTPDGCLVLNDVKGQVTGAFFNISPQVPPHPTLSVSPLYAGVGGNRPGKTAPAAWGGLPKGAPGAGTAEGRGSGLHVTAQKTGDGLGQLVL